MSVLPDELGRWIMEIGIETKTLDFKSMCCLSIVSRRFRLLAADDSLWSHLLLSDFPSPINRLNSGDGDKKVVGISASSLTSSGKVKRTYRIRCERERAKKRLAHRRDYNRYEREREKKLLAHRRDVLRIESEIAERLRKIREIKLQSLEEKRFEMEKKRKKKKRR